MIGSYEMSTRTYTQSQVFPDEGQTVMVVCVNAMSTSWDGRESWQGMLPNRDFGMYYARAVAVPPKSTDTWYLRLSGGTPGTTSAIVINRDDARSWRSSHFHVARDLCIWAIRVNRGDPSQLAAGTKYGTLYRSQDGGLTWARQWRSFPEIGDVLLGAI